MHQALDLSAQFYFSWCCLGIRLTWPPPHLPSSWTCSPSSAWGSWRCRGTRWSPFPGCGSPCPSSWRRTPCGTSRRRRNSSGRTAASQGQTGPPEKGTRVKVTWSRDCSAFLRARLKEDTLKPHLAHSGDVGKLSHLLLDRVWHDHDDLLGFEEVVGEEWWAGGSAGHWLFGVRGARSCRPAQCQGHPHPAEPAIVQRGEGKGGEAEIDGGG